MGRSHCDRLRHIGPNPRAESPRYAAILDLPGLWFWQVERFPHPVFYIEYEAGIDIARMLHAQRDIPALMRNEESHSR